MRPPVLARGTYCPAVLAAALADATCFFFTCFLTVRFTWDFASVVDGAAAVGAVSVGAPAA